MRRHPDAAADEVYVGNSTDPRAEGYLWMTKRVGEYEHAYDIDGQAVRGAYPVFVKAEEVREHGEDPAKLDLLAGAE